MNEYEEMMSICIHLSPQQLQKQIKHYKIQCLNMLANTLDTVLKTELAVTDGPASHHTSSSYLW